MCTKFPSFSERVQENKCVCKDVNESETDQISKLQEDPEESFVRTGGMPK